MTDHHALMSAPQPRAPGNRSQIVALSPQTLRTLRAVGGNELGEFALITAAIALLLRRHFGTVQVTFKTPLLSAKRGIPGTEIPILIEVRDAETVEDYLQRVAAVIETSSSEPPLGIAHLTSVALSDERLHEVSSQDGDDLQFRLRLASGAIEIRHSGAFEPFVIASLAANLAELLPPLVSFSGPIWQLDVRAAQERQLLRSFNESAGHAWDYPTVVAMFEAQVARTPTAPALVTDSSLTTYASLNDSANRLARHLREEHGVGPESMVGVLLDRSELMIVAVLGILKAGAAFVPIDTSYPPDRINYILSDTGLSLLITDSRLLERELAFAGHVLALDASLPRWTHPAGNLPLAAQPGHLAYVLYTSGSTGRPKGCLLEHRNLLNYVAWAANYYFADGAAGSFGLYSSLCFDFTLTNVFCPLVRGKSLRIFPQSQSIDTILARAFQAGSGVDTLKLTPSHIYILEQMKLARSGIRKIIVGGEELTPRHVEIVRSIDPQIAIYNEYGPTEATVGCIVKLIEHDPAPVLIGRPIANTRVYILDEAGMPAPVGVRGEIHVAGSGLARGYHCRPDITAARFIDSPFLEGERVYRTGDIGRWLPDGQIQSFGRIDDQVKIRGHRIELGEIEGTLLEHNRVSAAAVIVREDASGIRKLAAYVQGAASLTPSTLKEYLAASLPDYMIPADILFVREFPLNSNGKLDRARLAAAALQTSEQPEPTDLTAVQSRLLAIWRDILSPAAIGLSSRFFDLGGDSLLAIRLASRIWKTFGVELTLDEIFELQSLEALAAHIQSAQGDSSSAAPVIVPRARQAELPLSFGQQRLWFLAQLEGPSAAYNLSSALRFEGELDLAGLNYALSEIVRRHEVLRTSFPAADGRPLQSIAPARPVTLAGVAVADQSHALQLAVEQAALPFDLAHGPLYRAALYRVEPRLHVLCVVMHHIVSDAWSARILMEELAALYQRRELADLRVQYADYAAWQREHLLLEPARQQLDARKTALLDAPGLLELPTDRPRPPVQTFNGASISFELDGGLIRKLRSIAQQADATLFMILLAGYALLLSRYSRQKDLVIGSPIANRALRETEPMLGFFVNTLALRIDLSGNPTAREMLARVRRIALDGYASQEIPFEQIVEAIRPERSLSHSPLFQVMFAHETDASGTLTVPGLAVAPLAVASRTAKFDLTLYVHESASGADATLEYNTDLFDSGTAQRMVGHLRNLLAEITARPDAPIETLSLLTPEQRHRVVVEWNATHADYPDTPIHQLIERQVERTPNSVAAIYEATSLTYSELNAGANRLARQLIDEGLTPDTLVGVSMERSLEMIVALLAVLKAGGAYVPIDPDYPAERIRFMLESSQVRWLLAQHHLVDRLPATAARVIRVDQRDSSAAPSANPTVPITPDNLAYMIYTSGSTGRPKGALNSHGAITNRLLWMQETYRLTPHDAVLQKTPMSFDVSVWEFFWPLLAGARLVLARPGGHRESDYLIDIIQRHAISTLHFVPSMLRGFLDAPGVERCTSLRRIICSGEALPIDLQEKCFEKLPADLHNLYGPTEAAVDVTFWHCRREPARGTVPIGHPIANTRIYIVDEALQPCPPGVPGELLIGGVAVGAGYYREPELTAQKFIDDPFSDDPTDRLYRTGDLARYRTDGAIEFLGRLDHQIKLRGMRIELGEIETALRSHPRVADCVVIADQQALNTRLIAYVVPTAAGTVDGLREYLSAHLPEHMLPSLFVALEALPALPNGKLDRTALPKPAATAGVNRSSAPPVTPRQIALAQIWQEVLGLPALGVHDNFFELGGDSILSIQVVSRANRAGLPITAKQFFQNQTIATLAAAIDAPVLRKVQVDPTGAAPLTPVQHWFFEQHLSAPGRFIQTALVEVPFDIDVSRLERAILQLHANHDALRLRFRQAANGWSQEVAASTVAPEMFVVRDIQESGSQRDATLQAAAQDAEQSIDIAQGRLIAARLFRQSVARTARLFVAVHHLAIDGVSWRILLEDLRTAYEGQPLAAKTTSFREWALHLTQLAGSPSTLEQASVWRELLGRDVPALPIDHPESRGLNYVADTASVSFQMSELETTRLLRELPQAYRTRINDVLLAALARAFAATAGLRQVRIDLESHGRHEADDAIDLSRTVGWFTSIYPVVLETDVALTPEQTLQSVHRQLLRIPTGGSSYPLLRYLCPDETLRSALAAMPKAEILFNYHGQIDTALSPTSDWRLATENLASLQRDADARSHVFEIICAVVDAKLHVDWSYSKRLHTHATVAALAQQFEQELRAQLQTSAQATGRSHKADRYELSPLQQGILFHALYDRDPAAYFQQFSFTIEGPLDPAAFRQAWANCAQRHDVLRTAIEWEHHEQPLQVVHADVELPWETLDWRDLNAASRQEAFETFLIRDRRRGFQMQRAPLFRCTLVQQDIQSHRFCWSAHHIILDGWSTSILMTEVFEEYLALTHAVGVPSANAPAPSYRRYIEWLATRSHAEHEAYWRAELRGFRFPTRVMANHTSSSKSAIAPEESRREQTLLLAESLTTQIQAQTRANHFTLNVLLRGVWAMLLGRYSQTDDVLFGVTVSGRPATLAGVESMVGLFINTIPARIHLPKDRSLVLWLRELHAAQVAVEPHAHSSLADIQRWSEVPTGNSLFEALLVFENFPDSGPPSLDDSGIAIRDVRTFAESSYPLMLTVSPGARIAIRLSYDSSRLSGEAAERMLGHIRAMLEGFAAEPAQLCQTLFARIPLEELRVNTLAHASEQSVAVTDAAPARRTTPHTADEERLIEIWQNVLGRTDIQVSDDYFKLGGDSLLAVRLMPKIEQAFGRQLPISWLFRNPTIERLAQALGQAEPVTAAPGLVQLRSGGPHAPLFLLPGAGGNVLYFHPLANRLAPVHAVYALEAVGLDGTEPPLTRVEDIAERHIASMWPVAGAGPYYLAGHSFGASVAVEMSRQLAARGATVGCLAIFDAYAPLVTGKTAYWQGWDEVDWLLAIAHDIGSFLGASLELARADLDVRSPEERLALMVTRIASRGSWLSDTAPERLRTYLDVYQANFRAVYAPVAEALDVPIALFRSTESDENDVEPSAEFARLRSDPTWGWSHFSRLPVEVIDTPGTHLAMLLEPHVGPLAARLDELLLKAAR